MDFDDDGFQEFMDYAYEDNLPVPRVYVRNGENPFDILTNSEFKRRYRFSKECVNNIIMPLVVPEHVGDHNSRGLPLPVHIKLLTALRFYATGSMQIVCGDLRCISQPSVSRIIADISECLARHLGRYVKFPSTQEAITHNKRVFYDVAGFPDVMGCIDCTHIPVRSPGGPTAEMYRNRKGWMSLNVQVVCGPKMEILNTVIRWPGSAHDNRIFENSGLMTACEERRLSGILLGDSGYAQKQYLFTPVLHTQNEAENRYNRAHIRTRNIVERLFGVWKRKFSCLSKKLNTKLRTTTRVIAACAVLHNIGITYENDVYDNLDFPDRVVPVMASETDPEGKQSELHLYNAILIK